MTEATNIRYYYVDEAGDLTLFNKKGKISVGEEGVSNVFMLGLLYLPDPLKAKEKLEELRSQLLADPRFKDIPSIEIGLQIIDYYLWALQRLYERNDDSFFRPLAHKYSLIIDLDDKRNNQYGEYYKDSNPLTLQKLKPLVS